jgi:hypothetical protein
MMMMRWFLSVVVVSLLLLHVALFSLSSHSVHLHGGLVLDHFHGNLLGLGARVLGGGTGGGFQRSVVYSGLHLLVHLHVVLLGLGVRVLGGGEGGGELLVVGVEGGGELLVVGGEGGGGGELLVNI